MTNGCGVDLDIRLLQQGTPGSKATLSPTCLLVTPAPTSTISLQSKSAVNLLAAVPKAGGNKTCQSEPLHNSVVRRREDNTEGYSRCCYLSGDHQQPKRDCLHGRMLSEILAHPADSCPNIMGVLTTKWPTRPCKSHTADGSQRKHFTWAQVPSPTKVADG